MRCEALPLAGEVIPVAESFVSNYNNKHEMSSHRIIGIGSRF